MGLEVIVGRRNEAVIEGFPDQLRLYRRSKFQCIIAGRKRIRILSGIIMNSSRLTCLQNTLKGSQGIQRTGETGIGV